MAELPSCPTERQALYLIHPRLSRAGDIACRTIFWTYCLQVAQWLAELDDLTGSREAGLGSGEGPPLMAHQGRARLLREPFRPTTVLTSRRWRSFLPGG
jgi:hypothetical protein